MCSASFAWPGGGNWGYHPPLGSGTGTFVQERRSVGDGKADDGSAGAVTIYKCTTLPGLADMKDYTCLFPELDIHPYGNGVLTSQ